VQDTIDAGRAPTGGDDQTRDVLELEGTSTGDEALVDDGDAAMSPSGVNAAAAID
jgi:hypothetical protein